jgi:hypothetical protein
MLIDIDERILARLFALYDHEFEECRPKTPDEALAGAISSYTYLRDGLARLIGRPHPIRHADVRKRFENALTQARRNTNLSEQAFRDAILDLGLAAAEDVLKRYG